MLRKHHVRLPSAALGVASAAALIFAAAGSPGAAQAAVPRHPSAPAGARRASDLQPELAVTWSAPRGPVPGATTIFGPALTNVDFPGIGIRAVLLWTGPQAFAGADRISFEHATDLAANTWSQAATVADGVALTDTRPSAASLTASPGKLIAVWRGYHTPGKVWYSIGTAEDGGVISWSSQAAIPGSLTADGPTVFSLLHSKLVIVTWTAADHTVDYVIGQPSASGGAITWGPVLAIPGSTAASTPTVAEASVSDTSGRVYVLWRGLGSNAVEFSSTPDPLASQPGWTTPIALAGRLTGAAPAAAGVGTAGAYPLLIVYRALHSAHLLYVTLASNGTLSPQEVVPDLMSESGPALADGTLAETTTTTRHIRYEQYHICGDC